MKKKKIVIILLAGILLAACLLTLAGCSKEQISSRVSRGDNEWVFPRDDKSLAPGRECYLVLAERERRRRIRIS